MVATQQFMTLPEIRRAGVGNTSREVWDYATGGSGNGAGPPREQRAVGPLVVPPRVRRRGPDMETRYDPRDQGRRAVDVPMEKSRQSSLTWKDVEWLQKTTSLPIILKGIQCAEDARLAVEHGVPCVYVSNHGGRQLDHAPATIESLAEGVDAVARGAAALGRELAAQRRVGGPLTDGAEGQMAGIKIVKPADRDRGTAQTAGMVREAGISQETAGVHTIWSGYVKTPPGSASGTHHH